MFRLELVPRLDFYITDNKTYYLTLIPLTSVFFIMCKNLFMCIFNVAFIIVVLPSFLLYWDSFKFQ